MACFVKFSSTGLYFLVWNIHFFVMQWLKRRCEILSHTLIELILRMSKCRVLKIIFRPKLEEVMEDWLKKNCIVRSFMICTPQLTLGWSNGVGWDRQGMWYAWEGNEVSSVMMGKLGEIPLEGPRCGLEVRCELVSLGWRQGLFSCSVYISVSNVHAYGALIF